jgi:hypothetical protein
LLLVAKDNRFKRKERFAGLLHWLYSLFEPPGGCGGA